MSQALPPLNHILVVADRKWGSEGPSLLQPYLAQHPGRVADLWRYVPEVRDGLHALWTVRDGHVVLERMEVKGQDDPIVEMALWHALFPGLRRPVVAWWLSGAYEVKDHVDLPLSATMVRPLVRGKATLTLQMDHGRVLSADPAGRTVAHSASGDPFTWPLPLRLLLTPFIVLVAPVGVVMVIIEGRRKKDPVPLWFPLLLPLLTPMILLKWIAPGPFDRYLEPYMHRVGRRFQQRRAVEELVNEALRRKVPDPVRGEQH
jgi:hypothetical protein